MRTAVFSDVHGNLPALELMLNDAKDVDAFICLGDVVNYGPWSNECVKIISQLDNCISIIGNHEEYFIKGKCDANHFLVQEFFKVCFDNFLMFDLIHDYKNTYAIDNTIFCHTIDNKYIYSDSDIVLNNNYVIGHSHQQYKIESNGYTLFNPGSVGQNRRFINEINYMIYDTINKTADFKSIIYNVDTVINEMIKKKYPKVCLDYYRKKLRK